MRKKRKTVLFKELNFLIVIHIIAISSALICDFSSEPYIPAVKDFFLYEQDILISSLMIVWTFWTAIMIYYLGKKDENFCGLSNWRIIFAALQKYKKYSLFTIFAVDLILILVTIFREIKITLFVITILLPIMAFYTFAIVLRITDKKILLEQLKQLAYDSCINKKGKIENAFINELISGIDMEDKEQMRLLLEILQGYISYLYELHLARILQKQSINALIIQYYPNRVLLQTHNDIYTRALYQIMRVVMAGIKDSVYKRTFYMNLAVWIEQQADDDLAIEGLSALLAAGMESEVESAYSFFKDILSRVKNKERQKKLVLRGIVYNKYIECREGKKERLLICEKMKAFLDYPISDEEKKDELVFWNFLCKTHRETLVNIKEVYDLLG